MQTKQIQLTRNILSSIPIPQFLHMQLVLDSSDRSLKYHLKRLRFYLLEIIRLFEKSVLLILELFGNLNYEFTWLFHIHLNKCPQQSGSSRYPKPKQFDLSQSLIFQHITLIVKMSNIRPVRMDDIICLTSQYTQGKRNELFESSFRYKEGI